MHETSDAPVPDTATGFGRLPVDVGLAIEGLLAGASGGTPAAVSAILVTF